MLFCFVNHKLPRRFTVRTALVLASKVVARARPVFHRDFGEFLRNLRKARDWSGRGAASIAQRKGLPLTYQVLRNLENGQIKNPGPETLRAIADLYDIEYRDVVFRFVSSRYSLGLTFPVPEAINPRVNSEGSTGVRQRRNAALAGGVRTAIGMLSGIADDLEEDI